MTNYFYRCIGKGTTNSSGVAHITHDCEGNQLANTGYTGVGAGLMDFIASTDAPADISDGSFQSEPLPVWDCLFYDKGASGTGNHNTNWTSPASKVSRSFTSDGTASILSMETGQTWGYWQVANGGSLRFTLPFCVEVDIVDYTDTPRLRWAVDNTSINTGNTTTIGHWKWIITDTDCTVSVNGGTPTHLTDLESASKTNGVLPFFELDADTDKVTYKNFKLYLI